MTSSFTSPKRNPAWRRRSFRLPPVRSSRDTCLTSTLEDIPGSPLGCLADMAEADLGNILRPPDDVVPANGAIEEEGRPEGTRSYLGVPEEEPPCEALPSALENVVIVNHEDEHIAVSTVDSRRADGVADVDGEANFSSSELDRRFDHSLQCLSRSLAHTRRAPPLPTSIT